MSGNWQYMFTFHKRVASFGSTQDGGYEGIFQFPPYWLYVAFASKLKEINIPYRILDDFFIYDDNGEHFEE